MKKWLVSLAAVMALAGCADNTAGVRVDSLTQNVFFGDKVLGSRLQVEDIRTDLVDGHTRGIVRLNSNYKGDQHILYRFYWYDDAGLEVNLKQGPWKQAICWPPSFWLVDINGVIKGMIFIDILVINS